MGEPFTLCCFLDSPPPSIFSLSLICLPYFIDSATSLTHILLSFLGMYHISLYYWLNRGFSSGRRPLIPISICNLILDFFKCYLFNKPYSPLQYITLVLYNHWKFTIFRSFYIKELAQFISVLLDFPSLRYSD